MYSPLNDDLSVNLCSALIVNMSAMSTMRAVPIAFGSLFSLAAIGPWIVSVGHWRRMFRPTWLTAGCVSGMIPPVNRPPVAIDPDPVAGHRVFAAPPRHHGLYRTTGLPLIVDVEKSPFRCFRLGQTSDSFRVVPDR